MHVVHDHHNNDLLLIVKIIILKLFYNFGYIMGIQVNISDSMFIILF